mgnify:CR=1 FL=1
MTDHIRIVEVGPRDGLQNEQNQLTVEQRVEFINALSKSGLQKVEAGSFVSPKWVPQMQGTGQVLDQINKNDGTDYPVLIPNERGLDEAIKHPLSEIAVFTAASNTFTQKNINSSIEESYEMFKPIFEYAKNNDIPIRGYVSCAIACPYEGDISPEQVLKVSQKLLEMGAYEISIGDTIGVGTPNRVKQLLQTLKSEIATEKLAVHFHDTFGMAIANILAALEEQIHIIDSASAGLGGCPYASSHGAQASGNVATEDVLYLLEGLGLQTGVDRHMVAKAGQKVCDIVGKQNQSKTARAVLD